MKFTLIQASLGIPMLYLAATLSDQYRKPAVGSFEYMKKEIFQGCDISMKESFYCGDAAGRPKTETRSKDFSDSDIKFAANVGIKFLTPEELFLDQKQAKVKNTSLDAFFKKQASDQKAASKVTPKEEVK